jgi:ribosomal protein S11
MATTTTAAPAAKAKPTTSKKKRDLKLDTCVLHVQTTDNNTILTLVDENGNKVL